MALVYVNVGSNLGDKLSLISKAIEKISQEFVYYCLSEFVESEPWGFNSTNRFLNVGISFRSELHPEDILSKLQTIEKSICRKSHRDSHGNYVDREIDIDIMAIGEIEYISERLILPHPHLLERYFFLKPLSELNPVWCDPYTNKKITEIIEEIR